MPNRFIFFLLLLLGMLTQQASALPSGSEGVSAKDSIPLLIQKARPMMVSDADSAQILAESALRLLKSYPDKGYECDVYRIIGAALRIKGDYKSALYYFEKALKILDGTKDIKRFGSAYNNIGLVYWDLGNYVLAIENLLKALKASELSGNKDGALSANINIGLVYDYQEKYDLANKHYRDAIRLAELVEDKESLALLYNNLGYMSLKMHHYHTAFSFLQQSLSYSKPLGLKYYMALAFNNISVIYSEKGFSNYSMDTARIYMDSSYTLRKEINDVFGISMVLFNYGSWSVAERNYALGKKYLEEAYVLSRATDSKVMLRDVTKTLSYMFYQMGDYKNAYHYLDTFYRYEDSLFSEESRRKTVELQSEYRIQEKQRELDLLRKDSEIERLASDARLQHEKSIRWFFSIGAGVVLVILILVYRQYRQKQKANQEITLQKNIIEEKNKEILDSIQYAKRIQKVLMASEKLLERNLPEHFVLYMPKDIVSGDFYWAQKKDDKFLLAVADCTGHGVPGAFMSLLNISILNDLVSSGLKEHPAGILNKAREEIIGALNPEDSSEESKDGMDAVLARFDFQQLKLEVALANNPLWMIREGNLIEIKPDKMPVGVYYGEIRDFTPHTLELKPGDVLYLFTDGYADQFGGNSGKAGGKKFKYKQLAELLLENHRQPMESQKEHLRHTILRWRGDLEQNDDILLVGIRIPT
jgi:serine phosphatase RsbU (regulator of sigma subunit)